MKITSLQSEISDHQEIELAMLSIFQRRIALCSHCGIGYILSTGFFIWHFAITAYNINVLFWQAFNTFIFCCGYQIKYTFDRYPATTSTIKRWIRIFIVYSLACGLGWGSGIAYIAWHTTGISIAVISAVLMCVCGVGVSLAMSQLYSVSLFNISVLLPSTACLLFKGTSGELLVGTLMLIGLILILMVGYSMNQNLRTQVRTEIELRRAAREAQSARLQANQANSIKSQFLAKVSHEIRTPMNAVLGMLKLLQYTELNKRQADYTIKGEGAAKAMLGLLNDILDFSKIEAGKVVLNIEPVYLARFMQELMELLQTYAAQKPVQLRLELDPHLPEAVLSDPLRLRQILVNLGGNAIKFTEQGTVTLRINQIKQAKNFSTLRFEVKDNGIGIAPEKQIQIFEEFTQAENSTTRRFGGTGLGLSISKQLVQAMGGCIQLQSALGQGSIFSFDLNIQTICWNPSILQDSEEIYHPHGNLPNFH